MVWESIVCCIFQHEPLPNKRVLAIIKYKQVKGTTELLNTLYDALFIVM